MASASRAKAANPHSELTTWCAASAIGPRPVATHTVTRIAARSDSVRTSSGMPVRMSATIPPGAGRSDAPTRRAPRTTTATSTAPIPSWVSAVPSPDPAMPIPAP